MKILNALIALTILSIGSASVQAAVLDQAAPNTEQVTDEAAPVAPPAIEVTEATATLDPTGIYGADEAATQEIVSAINRFEAAGLALPALRIYVHSTTEPCNTRPGLYSLGGDQLRVDICSVSTGLIIHELAHAWEYHNVDAATRTAFLTEMGLEFWNSHEVSHPARGVEQAADAIKWGLEEQAIQRISVAAYSNELARFEMLTGTTSPRIDDINAAYEKSAAPRPIITAANVEIDNDFE